MSAAKLYYTPTSCGAASFIAGKTWKLSPIFPFKNPFIIAVKYILAHVAGVQIDTDITDIYKKLTSTGEDFLKINPKVSLF